MSRDTRVQRWCNDVGTTEKLAIGGQRHKGQNCQSQDCFHFVLSFLFGDLSLNDILLYFRTNIYTHFQPAYYI